MKNRLALLSLVLALGAALPLAAQQQDKIYYSPVRCMPAGENAILQMRVTSEGTLRAFLRRWGTTDWCAVDGVNAGHDQDSSLVFPPFEAGAEVEYYFVTMKGVRITARSTEVYMTKFTYQCPTMFTKNQPFLVMNCSTGQGTVPAAMGAGYSARRFSVVHFPQFASPERPTP